MNSLSTTCEIIRVCSMNIRRRSANTSAHSLLVIRETLSRGLPELHSAERRTFSLGMLLPLGDCPSSYCITRKKNHTTAADSREINTSAQQARRRLCRSTRRHSITHCRSTAGMRSGGSAGGFSSVNRHSRGHPSLVHVQGRSGLPELVWRVVCAYVSAHTRFGSRDCPSSFGVIALGIPRAPTQLLISGSPELVRNHSTVCSRGYPSSLLHHTRSRGLPELTRLADRAACAKRTTESSPL
jgi:hypothetical protein